MVSYVETLEFSRLVTNNQTQKLHNLRKFNSGLIISEKLLEKYFKFIVNKEFDKAYEIFEDILKLPNSNFYLYLCFWYPYSLSEETLVNRILSKTDIKFEEEKITKNTEITKLPKEFNSYAFDVAIKLNLSNDLIKYIVGQRKISLEIEFITELLDKGDFDLIELIWLSDAECTISSELLIEKFKSLIYKKDNSFSSDNEILRKKTTLEYKSI